VLCIDQAVIRRPLNTEARAQFHTLTCEVCGGRSGTGCVYLRVFPLFTISIVPSVPKTHIYLHVAPTRTNGQGLRTFCSIKQCSFGNQRASRRKVLSINESQEDALFLNFILVKNSTRFGLIYCPSSGVLILCSQQLVFFVLVMLTVC
jgi:hypothetical protein